MAEISMQNMEVAEPGIEQDVSKLDVASLKVMLYRDVLAPIMDRSIAVKLRALNDFAASKPSVPQLGQAIENVSTELTNIENFASAGFNRGQFA